LTIVGLLLGASTPEKATYAPATSPEAGGKLLLQVRPAAGSKKTGLDLAQQNGVLSALRSLLTEKTAPRLL
jgi:hypothetical protein